MTEEIGVITADSVQFSLGTVLTGEMLTRSYAFPRNYLNIFYKDVDNCIVAGMDLVDEGSRVVLKPGIIKYEGEMYFLNEEVSLTEIWQKVQSNNEELSKKGNAKTSKFIFVPEPEICHGNTSVKSMRLIYSRESLKGVCVGKSQVADKALNLPKTLADFRMDRNFMQLLEVKYYSDSGITFHPYVFQALKKELEAKSKKDIYDFQLLMVLGSNRVVGLDTLKAYMEAKKIGTIDSEAAGLFDGILKAVQKQCEVVRQIDCGAVAVHEQDNVPVGRPQAIVDEDNMDEY